MNRGILAIGLCLASGLAAAQDFDTLAMMPDMSMTAAPSDKPAMVLTPARVSEPQSEVPASVTVIDRQLIVASGARELYEVLRLVPGMAAMKVDGNVPTVSYHPTQAVDVRRMLVLVDGRSVYQPGLARVSWNDLPLDLDDVERIEVTRGPAAAAYGANAFTGVINIITRDPRDVNKQSLTVRGGNNGVADGRLSVGDHFAGGAWRVNAARRSDNGYDKPYQQIDPHDAKQVEMLNSEWVRELDGANTLTLQAGGSRSRLQRREEAGLRDIGQYQSDPLEHSKRFFGAAQWLHEFDPGHQLKITSYGQYSKDITNYRLCYNDPFDPSAGLGSGGGILYSKELRDLFEANNNDLDATLASAASDPALLQRYMTLRGATNAPFCADTTLDIRETRYDLEVQDTRQFTDWARLVSGINLRYDEGASQAYLSGSSDNVSYRAFGNLALKLVDPVTLNLGGYWEHDQISGRQFSPRLGLNWQVFPGHYLRYVFSKAIRTPDIYEDRAHINLRGEHLSEPYASNTQALLGWSPAYLFATQSSPGTMKPERIRSSEVGYYGKFAGVELDLRFFREQLRDLLSDPLTPFEFNVNNNGRVDHQGWEGQLTWRPNAHHLLRLAGAHIRGSTNDNTEARIMARNSGSALWAWEITRHWGVSSAYYLARDYNDHPFQRLNVQLLFNHRIGKAEIQWRATLQRSLNSDPVVYDENLYQDHNHYWLGATVSY
ncbi:MAG: TonB-dependent receptor [Alcanivorax sp.]|nr:TonB-dependent receptor [Alcanivorax sp.]